MSQRAEPRGPIVVVHGMGNQEGGETTRSLVYAIAEPGTGSMEVADGGEGFRGHHPE